jgi:outer membrane receptor protein involved in Fe transport
MSRCCGRGARWSLAQCPLGYRLTTTAAGQHVLDLNRPIKGSPELAVDTFASYSLRKLGLWKLKSDWKLQLNIRNLLDGDGLIPTQVLTGRRTAK